MEKTLRILKTKKTVKTIAYYTIITLVTLLLLFPLYVMLSRCFMTEKESMSVPVRFFPTKISFVGFEKGVDASLFVYMKNTFVVLVVNVLISPFVSALCAFGFARLKFKGRTVLFAAMMATSMMPTIVTQIPLYVMFVKIGWTNNLAPLTVPAIFGGGAGAIFLIIQYMRSIPKSIQEAVDIDGGNWFVFFTRFMIPLCWPVIALTMINTFLAVWNDFMGPLIYLTSDEKYTLAVGVYNRFLNEEFAPSIKCAVATVMMIPPVILFAIFQKQLIEGVSLSGMKL